MNFFLFLIVSIFFCYNLCEAYSQQSEYIISSDQFDDEWQNFKQKYRKFYDNMVTEKMRKLVFSKNLRYITYHNMRYALDHETFTLGVNEFADWTHEEFVNKMLGMKVKINDNQSNFIDGGSTYLSPENLGPLPAVVNWTKEGYVTDIKDQKQCGSCWAFSATGSMEGQTYRKTKKLVSLSEQNLVDCSGSFGNMGCEGGLMTNAFKYVMVNKGINDEQTYPYTATDGNCQFNKNAIAATITGFTVIKPPIEATLQEAVANVGPISVGIDASHKSFQFYKSGVYYERGCSRTELDHGVLAVGYGTLQGTDYWLVKNSWGRTWGMNGYILMSRNKGNQCGIATAASYPNV